MKQTNEDRASVLAIAAAKSLLACFAAGRLPGVAPARKAWRLAQKAQRQHLRSVALAGGTVGQDGRVTW